MTSFYFDTSALVKFYVEEEGTARILHLADNLEGDRIVVLDVTLLEARSAVRRRERQGDISGSVANQILHQIEEDASSLYLVQPFSSGVMEEAARLLDTHPLRTYDALQLAGCLVIGHSLPAPVTFVCADARLCKVASMEGLATLNPLEGG